MSDLHTIGPTSLETKGDFWKEKNQRISPENTLILGQKPTIHVENYSYQLLLTLQTPLLLSKINFT